MMTKFLLLAAALLMTLVGLTACEFGNAIRWMSVSLTPTFTFTPTLTTTNTATPTPTITLTNTATATFLPTQTLTATSQPAETALKNTPDPAKAASTQNTGACSGTDSQVEASVLNLINTQRTGSGVAAVQASSSLAAIARNYSKSMAENGFFDHGNVGGRVNPSNIYAAVGEIIYAGPGPYNKAEQAIATWLNSPVHRERMLDPVYTIAGVGYWCDPASEYQGYFTVDFAKP